MRALILVLALCACGAPPADPPPATVAPARNAVPTTRLVVPVTRDRDCADFATQAHAQAGLRSGDPDRLDADRDGSACERLRR